MAKVKVAKFLSSKSNAYISTALKLICMSFTYTKVSVIWYCIVISLFLKMLYYSSYRNNTAYHQFILRGKKTNFTFKAYNGMFRDEIINWNIKKCFISSNALFFFPQKARVRIGTCKFCCLTSPWLITAGGKFIKEQSKLSKNISSCKGDKRIATIIIYNCSLGWIEYYLFLFNHRKNISSLNIPFASQYCVCVHAIIH